VNVWWRLRMMSSDTDRSCQIHDMAVSSGTEIREINGCIGMSPKMIRTETATPSGGDANYTASCRVQSCGRLISAGGDRNRSCENPDLTDNGTKRPAALSTPTIKHRSTGILRSGSGQHARHYVVHETVNHAPAQK